MEIVMKKEEKQIINEVKNIEFKKQLTEGFQNGDFMTADEFCQRLEMLKASLIKKQKMVYGNGNNQ